MLGIVIDAFRPPLPLVLLFAILTIDFATSQSILHYLLMYPWLLRTIEMPIIPSAGLNTMEDAPACFTILGSDKELVVMFDQMQCNAWYKYRSSYFI